MAITIEEFTAPGKFAIDKKFEEINTLLSSQAGNVYSFREKYSKQTRITKKINYNKINNK